MPLRFCAWLSSLCGLVAFASTDYSYCAWMGNNVTNAPLYPMDVCTAHSHEQALDGLSQYSTKYACNSNGWVDMLEWNNTECDGAPYHTQLFRKEDGWYFNCGSDGSLATCPFVKMVFWEKRELNISLAAGHDEHLCLFDTKQFHELAVVTNMCIDLVEEYGVSTYVDCTARKVSYTEFNDSECTVRSGASDYFEINEGCDDPYDLNAYFQVAECEDAKNLPTSPPAVIVPSSANGGGSATDSDTTSSQSVATMVVGVVAVILLAVIIVMAFILCQRQQAKHQVRSVNVDEQPLYAEFQSIEPEPINAFGQQLTTQGQDIQEIQISQ